MANPFHTEECLGKQAFFQVFHGGFLLPQGGSMLVSAESRMSLS